MRARAHACRTYACCSRCEHADSGSYGERQHYGLRNADEVVDAMERITIPLPVWAAWMVEGVVLAVLSAWIFAASLIFMNRALPRSNVTDVALIGAFAFALLQELFKSEAIFGAFAKHWHLGLGLSIIASVALLPRGLVGVPAQLQARLWGRSSRRAQSLGGTDVSH